MRRIIVWVDTENREVSRTLENLKKFLSSAGLKYSIIDICELAKLGEDK